MATDLMLEVICIVVSLPESAESCNLWQIYIISGGIDNVCGEINFGFKLSFTRLHRFLK
jgi:hypothetical protein